MIFDIGKLFVCVFIYIYIYIYIYISFLFFFMGIVMLLFCFSIPAAVCNDVSYFCFRAILT